MKSDDGRPCAFVKLVISLHAGAFSDRWEMSDMLRGSPDPVRQVLAVAKTDGTVIRVSADEDGRIVIVCPQIEDVKIYPFVEIPKYRGKVYDSDIPALPVVRGRNDRWIIRYPSDARYVRCENQSAWHVYRISIVVESSGCELDIKSPDPIVGGQVTKSHKEIDIPLPYVSSKWPIMRSVNGAMLDDTDPEPHIRPSLIQLFMSNEVTHETKKYNLYGRGDIADSKGAYRIDIDELAAKSVNEWGEIAHPPEGGVQEK
ncbi:hypothetical protein HYR69_04445 [Candidatus Sumerlaeota bacterium]|nr:hypothetical protein [Candidatus Sumerlaeota bacterium]